MKLLNRHTRLIKIIAAVAVLTVLTAVFAGCNKKAPEPAAVTPEPYGFAVTMARTTSTAETGSGTRTVATMAGENFKVTLTTEITGNDLHHTQMVTDENGERTICEIIIKDGKTYFALDEVNRVLRAMYGAFYGEDAEKMFPHRFITGDQLKDIAESFSGMIEESGLTEDILNIIEEGDKGIIEFRESIDEEALEEQLRELDEALIEAGIMTGDLEGFDIESSCEELERIVEDTFDDSEYKEKVQEVLDMLKSEGWSETYGDISFSLKIDDFSGTIEAPAPEDTKEVSILSWLESLMEAFGKNSLTDGEQ